MNILNNNSFKHFLVLGLAKSGTVTAQYLLDHSYKVRISDLHTNENDSDVQNLKQQGAEVILGSHPSSILDGIDCVVKNPGIPYNIPILEEAKKRNILIVTEVELARELTKGDMIGITGSNGKTTTTTLITKMLEAGKHPVEVAGNIGRVALEVANQITNETMVVELSSFQLLSTAHFRPNIAVLLNVFPAHLDYHKTMDHYIAAKLNIIKHQNKDDFVVFNYDDLLLREKVESTKSKKIPFSNKGLNKKGAWANETSLFYQNEMIIQKSDIALVGEHNYENILAAIAAVKISGISNESIRQVLREFGGVKHRLQYVDKINGRLFYNDSKATNMLATEKALSAFERPTILLCGGLSRGDNLDELIPSLQDVKAMITFGQTSEEFQLTARKANINFVKGVKTMQEAVEIAYKISEKDDVILLSPACASWDQYKTFEQRGDMFIKAIHTLV